tara:strand:+ start:204 stop:725 length:522 start_codon:yes stop_codon:yes gene_type:complete
MNEYCRNHVVNSCNLNCRELDMVTRLQPMRTSKVDREREQVLDLLHKRRTAGMLKIKNAEETRAAQMRVWEQQRLRTAETRRRACELRNEAQAERQEVHSSSYTLTELAAFEATAVRTEAQVQATQHRRVREALRTSANTAHRAESISSRVRDDQRCAHSITCACNMCTCNML